MKSYKKPQIINLSNGQGIVPAAVSAITSLAAAATTGVATAAGGVAALGFAAGVASGLMKDNKIPTTKLAAIGRVIE